MPKKSSELLNELYALSTINGEEVSNNVKEYLTPILERSEFLEDLVKLCEECASHPSVKYSIDNSHMWNDGSFWVAAAKVKQALMMLRSKEYLKRQPFKMIEWTKGVGSRVVT